MGALSSKFLEYLKYEEGYKQPFLTLAINNNLKELTLYDTNEYHIRVSDFVCNVRILEISICRFSLDGSNYDIYHTG
jgi:hypothetical protein